jgi:hypothetical protein
VKYRNQIVDCTDRDAAQFRAWLDREEQVLALVPILERQSFDSRMLPDWGARPIPVRVRLTRPLLAELRDKIAGLVHRAGGHVRTPALVIESDGITLRVRLPEGEDIPKCNTPT